MNERDRNKDRVVEDSTERLEDSRERLTVPYEREPPPPVVAPPPRKRYPCDEFTKKLEEKRKELEEKQAEIEELTAESLRVAGLDDVLTPKNFKQLHEKYLFFSVRDLHRYLKTCPRVMTEYFKDWVKAGMPESSDEEKHKKVSDLLRKYREAVPGAVDDKQAQIGLRRKAGGI